MMGHIMQIKLEESNNKLIVHAQGRLDSLTAPDFEHEICALMINKVDKNIIIDFTHVEYISSAGLRSLLIIAKKALEHGVQVIICCLSENISDVIRMTGFLSLFTIYSDLDSAFNSISEKL